MTIGYVHVGEPEHGVSRYGRLLAGEARNRPELRVLECEARLTGEPQADRRRMVDAGRELSGADVIHLQYNSQLMGCLWGPRWRQLLHLSLFARTARAPLVATLHDVPARPRRRGLSTARHPIQGILRVRRLAPQAMTLRWLQSRASRLLVCSAEERARVASGNGRVTVIPHFVESREQLGSCAEAKSALGLSGMRLVTLLGYIHQRKGHDLMVEALAALPADVMVVFAGTAPEPNSPFVRALTARAVEMGVADRLRITGFLSDDDLAPYLAATDLAVCPFVSLSASGSLSTWISVRRPILASDLPQIAEYNAVEPGAIRTFRPQGAQALAEAIRAALDAGSGDGGGAVARLRARLLLPSVFDRHVEVYRGLLDHRPAAVPGLRKWMSAR